MKTNGGDSNILWNLNVINVKLKINEHAQAGLETYIVREAREPYSEHDEKQKAEMSSILPEIT